jgi:SAM-dependent methyltransferase
MLHYKQEKKMPNLVSKLKKIMRRIHKPRGNFSFVYQLKPGSSILDVGCGNNSPFWTKQILPNCFYTGIDIAEYNQTSPNLADKYIISTAENFAEDIAKNKNCFDAVISSHNLEHCNDRQKTLEAMVGALKSGGLLFLSFPSEKSVNFPSRPGTLCYYDDHTHTGSPPDFDAVIQFLKHNGFRIIFASRSYKPFIDWLIGLLSEPRSRRKNFVTKGTWSYYGFTALIWAKKDIP